MIGIITDSTCDIPDNLLNRFGIIVVPQVLIWGEEQYRDRIDLQPAEFYHRLEVDHKLPHSSQPSQREFEAAYESAASRGFKELIVLTISSALSGTFEIAKTAAKSFNIPVEVIDSRAASMGLGWQVLAAARARENDGTMSSILSCVTQVQRKIYQYAGMNTLEFLKKGGRIGDAARWATTLLKVKPIVSLNFLTNLVEPIGLARTDNAMVDLLYSKFFDRLKGKKNLRIAVLHGNVQEKAETLTERIKVECNPIELLVNITGPVMGIHTGPGALGLCGYSDD